MEYKGYTAEIEFDNGDQYYHGRVPEIEDVITFEGKNHEELEQAFVDSIEDYLDFCRVEKKAPSKPLAGSMKPERSSLR